MLAGIPSLLFIAETKVKPERDKLSRPNDRKDRERWWQIWRIAGSFDTRSASEPGSRSQPCERTAHGRVRAPRMIYNEQTVVFAFDDHYHFALLQSNVHEAWVWKNASSLESRNRYTPTDCFETFAFPQSPPDAARVEAERLGEAYHEHRQQTMLAGSWG